MAGNANSGRKAEKPFRDALRMEIAAAGPDQKKLRAIALKLLDMAEAGDMQAIKEVADRTDGKVPQGIIGGGEDDPPVNIVNRIVREIVEPNARSGNPDS